MTSSQRWILRSFLLLVLWCSSRSHYAVVSAWQWDLMLDIFGFRNKGPNKPATSKKSLPAASAVANIQVIGAGLPRSGTDSLREALEHLGFHAYHAQTVGAEGHFDVWKPLFQHQAATTANNQPPAPAVVVDTIVQALLSAGYNATTDFPACFLFAELLERFPTAKVVLSVRDSPDQWAESYAATIGAIMGQSQRPPFSYFLYNHTGPFADYTERQLNHSIAYSDNDDEQRRRRRLPTQDSLVQAYEYWIHHVRATVPPAQLLEHNAKDGWEPLWQHLDIPDHACPTSTPYPRNNSRDVWRVIVWVLVTIADVWPHIWVVLSILGVAVLWVAWAMCRRILQRRGGSEAAEKEKQD